MFYTAKIKLTAPILGAQRSPKSQYRMLIRENNQVVVPLAHWQWAVGEGVAAISSGLDKDCFRQLLPFDAPTVVAYTRPFTSGDGTRRHETFEAIKSGAELTVNILVASEIPTERTGSSQKQILPPDQVDLELVLAYVGKFAGISQWGNKFGYGRFDLMELAPTPRDKIMELISSSLNGLKKPLN